ncbi:gamma-type small acid-soluble spore protein [Bacillus weihaiensis]|uniref:gamma-type small acid-soluble spore protein n=1 Tax=Bacillus weihaiensis TaxID=1547283 RepID=UPI002357209C|nr:gamma-type small acid-soluble spore protein [Bacillus weihaiensis]
MAQNNNYQAGKTASGTNIQHVKQQNAQAEQGQEGAGQYGTEFASQTDVQHVKKYNQQAEANKGKNS